MRKQEPSNTFQIPVTATVIALVVGIVTSIGSGLFKSLDYASSVATKSDLTESIQALRTYTDDKTTTTLAEAKSYSDSNKQKVMLELEGKIATLQSSMETRIGTIQTMSEKHGVKIDMVLDAVKSMRNEPWDARERSRRRYDDK